MKLHSINFKHLFGIFALVSVTAFSAKAQQINSLGSYQPSVIESEKAALGLYQKLPTENFKGSSGCFQRAHNWSYQLATRNNINSMKIFLFFTTRYQREFDYEWAYHVAPLLPVKKADGSVEEQVFDPTFVNTPSWETGEARNNYDNKPISVKEWSKYFIFPEAECPIVDNYQDFADYQERYYCYIIKTPMFTYIPRSIDQTDVLYEPSVRTSWRSGDLDQMKKAFKLEYRLVNGL